MRKPVLGQVKLTEDERLWATECGIRLEEDLFDLFKQNKTYGDKARMLLFNLQDQKNPGFKKMILDQKISPRQVLLIDPKKLASQEMKEKREEQILRAMDSCRTDWELQKTLAKGEFTGMFKCECGSLKTSYF